MHYCVISLWYINQVLSKEDVLQYTRLGDSSVLKCPLIADGYPVTWRHEDEVYSVGTEVNKLLRQFTRISVVGNISAMEYDLKITNTSHDDIGRYVCVSRNKSNVVDFGILLSLMETPTQMSITGEISNTIQVEENSKVNLVCKVKGGVPREILYWTVHNKTLVNGSGEVTYSLIATRSEHMNVYVCVAEHIALRTPMTKSVQLVLFFKPEVRVVADPGDLVNYGENVTLSCVIDNLLDLRGFIWEKDGNILHHRSSVLSIINAKSSDSGNYSCNASNKNGNGYSSIQLTIKDTFLQISSQNTDIFMSELGSPFTTTRTSVKKRKNSFMLYGLLSTLISVVVTCLLVIACSIQLYKRQVKTSTLTVDISPSTEGPLAGDHLGEAVYESIADDISQNYHKSGLKITDVNSESDISETTSESSSSVEGDTKDSQEYLNPYNALDLDISRESHEYTQCAHTCEEQEETELKTTMFSA